MAMTSINVVPQFPRFRGAIAKTVKHHLAVRRQRIALKSLDHNRLLDLGIDQNQAQKEAKRPIWDAPAHWKA